MANELCCFSTSLDLRPKKALFLMLGEKSIISLKYYFYSVLPSMGASRVKMYCDEIVISDAIIRTANLEMELLHHKKSHQNHRECTFFYRQLNFSSQPGVAKESLENYDFYTYENMLFLKKKTMRLGSC